MSLSPVYGHDALLSRLEGAIASGRFPQAALLVGPPGVGKQRLGLWVAQALLCERQAGRPCGTCPDCRLALELSHPDLHWFVPVPRPKAGTAERQLAEVEEALGEAMTERRAAGTWQIPDGMHGHSLTAIRLLQRKIGLTPFRGRRKVVLLGDAERLVVQEASPEAANALLKVLEEPPRHTTLVLTAAEPQALLPTVRSRTIPIRVGRVPDAAVRAFLENELDPAPGRRELEQRVLLAEGCIGGALAGDGGNDAPQAAAERFVKAVRSGPGAWSAQVLGQAPWGARGAFSAMLDALTVQLRSELAARVERGDHAAAGHRAAAVRRVESTRAEAQGNTNPQLALAVLARDLTPLL